LISIGKIAEVMSDRVVGERLEKLVFAAAGGQLEVAESNERRRDPAHDRARFGGGVSVVEHVAHHIVTGEDKAERTSGGDAEKVHCLAAQELAHAGSQDCAAVGSAAVRRWAGTLELKRLP
jgi:hypothetical protein